MKRLDIDDDPKKQEVIFNEVILLQNLVHPNIIKYYETFEHENKLCIVMEFAQCGTFHITIQQSPSFTFIPCKFLGDMKQRVVEKKQQKEFFPEDLVLLFNNHFIRKLDHIYKFYHALLSFYCSFSVCCYKNQSSVIVLRSQLPKNECSYDINRFGIGFHRCASQLNIYTTTRSCTAT